MSLDEKGTSLACMLKNEAGDSRVLLDYNSNESNFKRNPSLLNVSEIEASSIVENFSKLKSALSPDERGDFIGYLSKYQTPVDEMEYKSLNVDKYVFDFFENNPEVAIEDGKIEGLVIPEIFDQKQKQEVADTVKTLLNKIPKSKHDQLLSKINQDLLWSYNGLTESKEHLLPNFTSFFRDIIKNQSYEYESELQVPKFSIEASINKTFQNVEEIKEAIDSLPPIEEYPYDAKVSDNVEYRIVNLSEVVGGFNMPSWEISTSTSRGLPNILKNSQTLKESGYIDTQYPISYIFHKGKYYIYGDGRHRTVALKLMGVDKIPAKVFLAEDT